MVFVFFGLVAVVGTTFVQVHRDEYFFGTFQKMSDAEMTRRFLDWENDWIAPALLAGTAIGALACAILVANNLRDIPTDTVAGKMTLAVRLGDKNTRRFYVLLTLLALGALVATAALTIWWALLGLVFLAPVIAGVRVVLSGATGPGLIPVLQKTGVAELLLGAGVFAGLLIA